MKNTISFNLLTILILLIVQIIANENDFDEDEIYQPPNINSNSLVFLETFDKDWENRWIISKNEKYKGKWQVEDPIDNLYTGIEGDQVLKDAASYSAIVAPFKNSLDNTNKDLIIQYEVQFQNGLSCAGAYLKLQRKNEEFTNFSEFSNEFPYTIMFGPDKCDQEKVQFIINHKNPKTQQYSEHHLINNITIPKDKFTHLYTLHVLKNNSFEINIDGKVAFSDNLLSSKFSPSITPPKLIDDPNHIKPSDWQDNETIADINDSKPSDWPKEFIPDPNEVKPSNWLEEEPQEIINPNSKKPIEWDDIEDGQWIAPKIKNPKCLNVDGCGPWKPKKISNKEYKPWIQKQIPNPKFKGKWIQKQIPNPDYYENPNPSNFEISNGIGFELWTMNSNILFDNIIVSNNKKEVDIWTEKTFFVKYAEQHKKYEEARIQEATFSDALEEVRQFLEENTLMVCVSGGLFFGPIMFCCIYRSSIKKKKLEKQSVEKKKD